MTNRKFINMINLLVLAVLLTACGEQQNQTTNPVEAPATAGQTESESGEENDDASERTVREDGAFRIVATTTQAADIAQILTAGVEGVEISGLMGAGVDPHLYQPTEADIAAMNNADMVIYSGLHLEGQFDAVFSALNQQGVLVYALSKPVKDSGFTIGGFTLSEELVDVDDPHFWFDPRNWELSITDLAEVLAEVDPDNVDVYSANARAYTEQLTVLYDWANDGMTSVSEGQRYLVTSHDAFQYFGAAFGWEMAAIQGLSTEDEAGVGDIQGIVDFVIANNIPVVFVESSIPPDTVDAVIEAVDAKGQVVRRGVREMYSDAMGEPGTFGGTYIGMLAENVLTILQSYQCAGELVAIPEWPENLSPQPPAELLTVDCAQ